MDFRPVSSAMGSARPPVPVSNIRPYEKNWRPTALLLSENENLMGGPPGLFDGLSAEERRVVLAQGSKRVLYKGDELFLQDALHDGIYFIETGRIRVFYIAPSGREITLAYWWPGHFVGGPDIFGGGTHQWTGIAAANSSVVHLPGRALRTLITEYPQLAVGLLEGLAFKGRCYSALAQMLGTRSVTERLTHLLLHLAKVYGFPTPRGTRIEAAFTHADIAHMVGATRQWVTISLKRMSERGVLSCDKKGITLLQPEKLAQIN